MQFSICPFCRNTNLRDCTIVPISHHFPVITDSKPQSHRLRSARRSVWYCSGQMAGQDVQLASGGDGILATL